MRLSSCSRGYTNTHEIVNRFYKVRLCKEKHLKINSSSYCSLLFTVQQWPNKTDIILGYYFCNLSLITIHSADSKTSYIELTFLGTWGKHAIEMYPWSDSDRPVTRFTRYEYIRFNTTEEKGILTDRIIASCSSYLDKSPETNEYALCKCQLSRKVGGSVSLTFNIK